MTKIITFLGKSYAEAPFIGIPEGTLTMTGMMGVDLLAIYNLVSANLGAGRVKRFSDAKAAQRRTWARLSEFDALRAAEAAVTVADEGQHDDLQSEPEMQAYEKGSRPTNQAHPMEPPTVQLNSEPGRLHRTGQEPIKQHTATLSQADIDQISSEAASRKPATAQPLSEQLIAAAAAARKAPGTKTELWRRPKHEKAAKVAYRPKDGTIQATMYGLLTRPGGILVEEFCTIVEATGTRDKTLFTPSNVWAAMRYLYVASRGYGLDFDGQRLALIVPADERMTGAK